MVEADALIDTVLPRGLADVRQDRCAVDDRLRPRPRTERVAEREHVGVRADAREPKQIPRPPDCSSRLEAGEALLGAVLLQPTCGADTGDTGTYDQDVDVFARRHGSTRCLPLRQPIEWNLGHTRGLNTTAPARPPPPRPIGAARARRRGATGHDAGRKHDREG